MKYIIYLPIITAETRTTAIKWKTYTTIDRTAIAAELNVDFKIKKNSM
jgi:hypothetical protein